MKKMYSWRPSELCLLDENSSITCNLLMKENLKEKTKKMLSVPLTKSAKEKVSVLLSASFKRFCASPMLDFYNLSQFIAVEFCLCCFLNFWIHMFESAVPIAHNKSIYGFSDHNSPQLQACRWKCQLGK